MISGALWPAWLSNIIVFKVLEFFPISRMLDSLVNCHSFYYCQTIGVFAANCWTTLSSSFLAT